MMRIYILICALLSAATSLSAQSAFVDIITSAVENDKEFKARQAAGEAAMTFNDIDGPQIEFEHLWPSGNGESEVKWNLGISQDIDYPGLYRARSQVAGLERENASLVLLAVKADKALAVKQLIIDIINSHRRYELYSAVARNIALVDSLTRVSYDRGAATALDLWKMRFALLENEHNLAEMEGDIRALEGTLTATGVEFINGEDEFWHDYPLQPLINPDDAGQNMLADAIVSNSIALGNARIKATKLEAVPGFSIGYIHAFEENTHFNGFNIGLRLPSFSQKKKNQAARLEAEAARLEAAFEADNIRAELQGQYDEAVALSKALERYRELTGDDGYLKLLDKAYRGGELTVIEYLNEINLFITARIGYLDLEYRYNLALARLNRYRSLDF